MASYTRMYDIIMYKSQVNGIIPSTYHGIASKIKQIFCSSFLSPQNLEITAIRHIQLI